MSSTTGEHIAETGAQTLHGQASETAPGYVSTIKAVLGLNREGSPVRRLITHTIRKIEELEAAKSSTPGAGGKAPTAENWHNAQAPDSFGRALFKASRMQFFVTVGIFTLMVFWLFVIRTMHHGKDEAKAAAPAQQAAQQTAATQSAQGSFGCQQNALGFGTPVSSSSAATAAPMAPIAAEVPPPPTSNIPTGVALPHAPVFAASMPAAAPITAITLPTAHVAAVPHVNSMPAPASLPAPTSPQPPAGYPAPPPVAYTIPSQTPAVYSPTGFSMPQGISSQPQQHYSAGYTPQQSYSSHPHPVRRHQVVATR